MPQPNPSTPLGSLRALTLTSLGSISLSQPCGTHGPALGWESHSRSAGSELSSKPGTAPAAAKPLATRVGVAGFPWDLPLCLGHFTPCMWPLHPPHMATSTPVSGRSGGSTWALVPSLDAAWQPQNVVGNAAARLLWTSLAASICLCHEWLSCGHSGVSQWCWCCTPKRTLKQPHDEIRESK